MKLSVLLPWLCVVGALSGLAWFYSASQKKEAELVALRADSEQLQKLRAELEEAKTNQSQAAEEELTRLRKEHEEVLRLRNEVRQLRGDKQQLAGQVQAAQAQAQSAQAQVQAQAQALSAKAAPQAPTGIPLTPAQVSPEQANANICVNNLRLIDAAKQQWALNNNKPAGAIMTAADLAKFLPNNTVPSCPAGGVYTLNPVGLSPLCNVPGHALGK
jgi:hypothetical protein